MSESKTIDLKVIDLANEKNNQAVIDLVKETLIPGSISYIYDRSPTYHHFAATQGKNYELYGAYQNDTLLGITQITHDHVYLNGNEADIAYSGDTRIHPKAKGKKIADALIAKACLINRAVFGAVMGGNHLVLDKKLADWKKVGVDFKIIGELKVLLFKATKKKIKNHIATENDVSEMFKLWKEVKQHQNLARVYKDEKEFRNSYNTQGVSLERTVLVKLDNRIVGFLSVWDQDSVRKIQIKKIAPLYKVFTSILRLFIKVPKENENLPLMYSFQHCFHPDLNDRPELIQGAIQDAITLASVQGALLFSIGLDVNDPIFKTLQKRSLEQNQVKIICHNLDNLAPRIYHFEVGVG